MLAGLKGKEKKGKRRVQPQLVAITWILSDLISGWILADYFTWTRKIRPGLSEAGCKHNA
jgi:hypothetical protein